MKRILPFFAAVLVSGVCLAQTTRPATRPSPQSLLDQLLTPEQGASQVLEPASEQEIDKTTGKGAVAPGAVALPVLREGTYVVDRTGRIKTNSDGQTVFLFDADGKTLRDPPMILLPNLLLMSIQTAASNSSRDLHFRITGMVTEYKGRNYILLDKVVVVPEVAMPLK